MDSATAEKLKKFSPWIIGGVVGLFVLYKYAGGGSSGGGGADYSSYYAAQAQQNAQGAQIALANRQLDAQIAATNAQNQTAQIGAVGSAASTIAGSIAQVIQAQSYLPATAINASAAQNQAALMASAGVSAAAFGALPGMMDAMAKETLAGYSPLAMYGSSLIGLQTGVNAVGAAALNGVATSANSAVTSTANSASAAASANASAANSSNQSNASMFGSLAQLGGMALMFM
jgi:hypothetical protein